LILSNDTINKMKPPYCITPAILQLISTIAEKIGEINATHLQRPQAELRKTNRIKTIQSSLEIEGNTLSIEQVTAILENKRVLAFSKVTKMDRKKLGRAVSQYGNVKTKKLLAALMQTETREYAH